MVHIYYTGKENSWDEAFGHWGKHTLLTLTAEQK